MTTSDEKELREELFRSAGRSPVAVDLDAVIEAGQARIQQDRHRRVAVAGALGAVALAVGGVWMGLGQSRPVPAEPVTESSPPTQSVELVEGGQRLRVTAAQSDDDPGRVRLTTTQVSEDGKATGRPVTTTMPATRASLHIVTTSLCPDCVVTVVRGDAQWMELIPDARSSDFPGFTMSELRHLPDADLTVRLDWETGPVEDTPDGAGIRELAGVVWGLPDGSVRDHQGRDLPHGTGDFGGQQFVVWEDPARDSFGLQAPFFTGWSPLGKSSEVIKINGGSTPEGQQGTAAVAGRLPKGANLEGIRWTEKGEQQQVWQGGETSDGGSFFVAMVPSGKAAATQVCYRSAAGQLHTVG